MVDISVDLVELKCGQIEENALSRNVIEWSMKVMSCAEVTMIWGTFKEYWAQECVLKCNGGYIIKSHSQKHDNGTEKKKFLG